MGPRLSPPSPGLARAPSDTGPDAPRRGGTGPAGPPSLLLVVVLPHRPAGLEDRCGTSFSWPAVLGPHRAAGSVRLRPVRFRSAIRRLLQPSATSRSTSTSRSVSPRRAGLLPGGSAAQQPRHQRRGDVTSVGPVGTLRSHLDGELVPVQLRGLVREADAPGVEHQTRVQPSPHVLVGEVRRPGQRQRRRAERLARWEPEAEVGQPRHPGDEIDQAHRYSLPPPRTPPSGDASVDGSRWSRRTTVTESALRATCDVRGTTNHVAATRP
jgi:hypothetical protein